MYQNKANNLPLDSLIHSFTMEQYNTLLGELAREYNLVEGPFEGKNENLYNIKKDVIKKSKTFKHFACANLATDIGKSKILVVFTCLIASFKVTSIQEPVPASVYTGKASQTSSFAENPGVLADRQNEWAKLATLFMGINNPTRMKGTSIKV